MVVRISVLAPAEKYGKFKCKCQLQLPLFWLSNPSLSLDYYPTNPNNTNTTISQCCCFHHWWIWWMHSAVKNSGTPVRVDSAPRSLRAGALPAPQKGTLTLTLTLQP